jgi:hypothetical protein
VGEGKPRVDWHELYESTDFRELFRYRKGGRRRSYKLRVLGDRAELWVLSEGGEEPKSRKLATFESPDDVVPFLQSVEQELRAGGWQEG